MNKFIYVYFINNYIISLDINSTLNRMVTFIEHIIFDGKYTIIHTNPHTNTHTQLYTLTRTQTHALFHTHICYNIRTHNVYTKKLQIHIRSQIN